MSETTFTTEPIAVAPGQSAQKNLVDHSIDLQKSFRRLTRRYRDRFCGA
jgi:hypothetical protein